MRSASAGAALPLKLLAAAGFLSSAGARIVDPLLAPIAADLHTTVPSVSIILAAFVFPYGLNQIILGPLGDRFRKLRVLLCALAAYSVFNLACAFAGNLPTLTVLRACAGASSAGLIPVCLAYIGDAVPYELRQLTVSRFLAGVVVAQSLAGPVGGVFGEYIGWRGVFVLLAVGGVTVAAVLGSRIRVLPDNGGAGSFRWSSYAALARQSMARRLLFLTLIEGAFLPGTFPFIAPFLNHNFGLSYAEVGLILACFGIGAFAYIRAAGWLVQRLGEAGQILLGGGLIALGIGLGVASNRWQSFILVQIAIGFGYFALHTVLQARATELLPNARATSVASFVFLLFLGQALGALALGAGIAAIGYRASLGISAAGTAILTVVLALFIRATAQQLAGGTGEVANRSRHPP